MRRLLVPSLVLTAILSTACREPTVRKAVDGGIVCAEHEKLLDGECVFVCARDSDCGVDQQCNLFTGKCEAAVAKPDSGVPLFPCTVGATRCAADSKSIEACIQGGTWETTEVCPGAGFCQNETCLACKPGLATCSATATNEVEICKDDGSGTRTVTCSGAGVCSQGECRECAPNTSRCSPDGKTAQVCQKTNDETLQWKWANNGDSFDGTCITQVCEVAGGTAQCKAPDCFPGTTQCKNTTTQQVCSDLGGWTDQLCSSIPGFSSTAECLSGVCIDECLEAAKQKSYFGCEYWSAIPDNGVDKYFKGNTASGQGAAASDFAFVVANRSVNQATVKVYRWYQGAEQLFTTVTVPGKGDAATKGLASINVPWQSIGTDADGLEGATGLQRYGYRLVSDKPISVYQFSPLPYVKYGASCSNDNQCTAAAEGGVCQPKPGTSGKVCNYFTFSNDASLLLPAHILGTSYVAITPYHLRAKDWLFGTDLGVVANANMTIVATQDGTTVTVKSAGKTKASTTGTAVAAMNPGGTSTFTLNRYDVLQLASANNGSDLQCGANPFNSSVDNCWMANDLTGSVITSNKPVALFGGSACTQIPLDKAACDHVEEQIFPFSTWGKEFVAVKSAPLRKASGTGPSAFATTTEMAPDYWKIVASCPTSQCPNGTLIQISTALANADVLPSGTNRCMSGTSLQANNCRLAGGAFVDFKTKSNFRVIADQPIAVAQFFAGEQATNSTPAPLEGDPSMLLLPPVEQWRSNYTVLAAPGILDNYLGLSIDSTKVASVAVDGATVSGWTTVSGTNFQVLNYPVSVGTHTIEVTPKPGQTTVPGVGVTVYGFDSYVSYGYTGGLDLTSIVSGINPGG